MLELVFALIHGAAYLVEGVELIDWIYPSVLLSRLAVLLGLAGLSVRLMPRYPRLGKLSRVVLTLAVVFTLGLILLPILDIVGVSTPIIAVFGIGTVVLTLLSFAFFGVAGLRIDTYPTMIGGLMLVATLAVLFVLLGSGTFSTNVRGAVGEGVNAIAFLAIWYVLSAEGNQRQQRTEYPAHQRSNSPGSGKQGFQSHIDTPRAERRLRVDSLY